VIGAVLAIWIVYLMWSRRRRGRRLAELSAAEKAREEQARADERGADGRDAR